MVLTRLVSLWNVVKFEFAAIWHLLNWHVFIYQSRHFSSSNGHQLQSDFVVVIFSNSLLWVAAQCRNCIMYGHGAENCHRKPICIFCASSVHNSNDCPLKEPHAGNSTAAGRPIFKCHFCTINKLKNDHAANDENCPARDRYLNIRQNANGRNVKPQDVVRNVSNSSAHPATAQFPQIPVHTSRTRPNITFADATANRPPKPPPQWGQSQQNADNLFSMSELFDIFQKAVVQLKRCETKMDQMQVIVSLLQHAI